MTNDAWGDDELDTMKTLWAEGLSATQIVRALGGGRSRSAVLGKVHRLGLPGRAPRGLGSPATPRPRSPIHDRVIQLSPRQQANKLRRQPEPEPARLDNGERITTADLRHDHCRWPHGDVGTPDFHYCGLTPKAGSSWCAQHAARAVAAPYGPRDPAAAQQGRQAEAQFSKMWG